MASLKQIAVPLCCLLLLGGIVSVRAQGVYPFEYCFNSTNPGISGKLFLNAPSSSNGSIGDIGPGSYITFLVWSHIPPVTIFLSNLQTYDSTFSIQWNSTSITSPLFIGLGAGLSREFVSPGGPDEYDQVLDSNQDLSANGFGLQLFGPGFGVPLYYPGSYSPVIQQPMIDISIYESTYDVNGASGGTYIPHLYSISGEWLAASPVPEPGTFALSGLAILCGSVYTLCVRRRNRKE